MTEYELIRKCQSGDKSAFHALITFYYPFVSKFLIKLTSDEALAEDLTQETFLRLIRNIEKFDPLGSAAFSSYLIAIAKNLYLDHVRKSKACAPLEDQEDFPSPYSVEQMVCSEMQLRDLLAKIDQLPPEQGAAIKLKYLEQMTLSEIAARFQCEPKTIKSRIHNGIVKLRQILNKGGNPYGE